MDLEIHERVDNFLRLIQSDIKKNSPLEIVIESLDELCEKDDIFVQSLCEYPKVQSLDSVKDSQLASDIRAGKKLYQKDRGIRPNRYQIHVRTMPEMDKVGDIFISPDKKGPSSLNQPKFGSVVNVGKYVDNIDIGDEIVYPEKFGIKYPGIENPYGEPDNIDCEIRVIQVHHRVNKVYAKCYVADGYMFGKHSVQFKNEPEPKERKIIDSSVIFGGAVKVNLDEPLEWTDSVGREREDDSVWVRSYRVEGLK